MKKNLSQLRHASKRCYSRYKVALTQGVLAQLLHQIQNEKSVCVGRQTNTRSIHRCVVKPMLGGEKITLQVVYDKTRKTICTVLDNDMDAFEEVNVNNTYEDVLRERGEL